MVIDGAVATFAFLSCFCSIVVDNIDYSDYSLCFCYGGDGDNACDDNIDDDVQFNLLIFLFQKMKCFHWLRLRGDKQRST